MYDVLLIKPLSRYNLQYAPSLGLGFIASHLERNGFSAQIIDCNVLKVSPEHLPRRLSLEDYRLIGLQAYDMDLQEVKKYLQAIRMP